MSMDDTFDGWKHEGYHGSPGRESSRGQSGHQLELSPNDQRVLDVLVECGFDLDEGDLSNAERTRAERLMNLFGLLHDYPVDDPDETLIHATLARIDRHEQAAAERMAIANHGLAADADERRGMGFRRADLIAVAAAILLVASVVLPIMHSMRQSAIDTRCANNLRVVGYAFGNYAADNNGMMPVVQAASLSAPRTWDRFSNAVNFKPLLEGQYCDHRHCRCPGNHDNLQMTYSYQWQRTNEPMVWSGARITIAMGDRNPLMDAARQGRFLPPGTMSPDHRGRGQTVLATDGVVFWLGDEPVVGQADNIWLPHGARQLTPGAKPRDFWDVFLAH